MKDLRIFEDHVSKQSTEFPHYSENTPTFQGFRLKDDDNVDAPPLDKPTNAVASAKKVVLTKRSQSQKHQHPQKSRIGRTVKPTKKVKEAERGSKNKEVHLPDPPALQNRENNEELLSQLTSLLILEWN